MLVYPDAQILDISGPLEVFARTSRWLADRWGHRVPAYALALGGTETGALATSGGLQLMVRHHYRELEAPDTLLVSGGVGYRNACEDRELLAWLVLQSLQVARIGSICTGALVLAEAGLLEGREATTHWAYLDRLARQVPGCRVDPEAIYVRSGNVYTSAGVTAGIDMALALVEQDWGKSVALAVAQQLVVYRRRSARQAQVSRFLQAEQRQDRFGELQLWMLDHLDDDLSVERLAERAAMSPRHFSRQFRQRIGQTPAEFVSRLRVEEACRRLESGDAPLKEIARRCGFGDEQALRRAFKRRLGMLPQAWRSGCGGS